MILPPVAGKEVFFLHRVTESDFHKEPFLEKKEKELLARKNPSPDQVRTQLILRSHQPKNHPSKSHLVNPDAASKTTTCQNHHTG